VASSRNVSAGIASRIRHILEYIGIIEKEFGHTLTLDEARIEAAQFLELCFLVVQTPG
jgi:hypothetical protein